MTKDKFYSAWLDHFAHGISDNDFERYVVSTGNYLWHIFSWELINENKYLSGDAARTAFDTFDKCDAFYINWFEDEMLQQLPAELQSSKALEVMTEVYVVASDFSWTYMKTHEATCGPYFMKL